jgi:hypothetical protein
MNALASGYFLVRQIQQGILITECIHYLVLAVTIFRMCHLMRFANIQVLLKR